MTAFLIEIVIFIVMFVVIYWKIWPIIEDLISGDEYHATVGDALNSSFFLLFTILLYTAVLVSVIWGGLFEGIWGLTPGKAALRLKAMPVRLKVVSADDHNQTIGFVRGIVREIPRSSLIILYLLFTLSGYKNSNQFYTALFLVLFLLSVLVFVLDHLWLLWDKERQALHDKMANSHVLYTGPLRRRSL